ncbi:MAG TPA: VanZ family protein, partial [Gemmataceae bacterium]
MPGKPLSTSDGADRPARGVPMFPGRLCYGLCFLGFLALAVYGSLVPFAYRPLPTDEALRRWREIPYLTLGVHSRADFVANILLFVPLGFTLLGSLALDRRAWVGLAAAPFAAALLFGLSLAVEFAQIYFPPRTVSVNDIVAETAGAVLGVALW